MRTIMFPRDKFRPCYTRWRPTKGPGKIHTNRVVKHSLDYQHPYVPVAQIHSRVAEWHHACRENLDPRNLQTGGRRKGNGVHRR